MSVAKRGKSYYLRIRPFGELVNVRTSAQSKTEARQIEMAVLVALRSGNYAGLDPEAQEVVVRMFENQRWQLPPALGGKQPPKAELDLWAALDIFLNYPEIKQSAELPRYENCFVHLVEHFGKNHPIKTIWVPQIKRYMAKRTAAGVSPSTVNREKGSLSKLFQVLVELQLVETNPCRLVSNLSQKPEQRRVYLSLGDVSRIAEHCPEWYQLMVWLAYYSGMRRGEILTLKRDQVSLTKRMVYLGPEDTKERRWKRVPLRNEVIPLFESAMRVSVIGSNAIFHVHDHEGVRPIGKDSIKKPWPRACTSLKLPKPWPRFHDLRHTWKSNSRRSGIPSEIEHAIMGHAERGLNVHERYGYISDQELLDAVDRMTFDHGETMILLAKR